MLCAMDFTFVVLVGWSLASDGEFSKFLTIFRRTVIARGDSLGREGKCKGNVCTKTVRSVSFQYGRG